MNYYKGLLPGYGSYIYILCWFSLVIFLSIQGVLEEKNGLPLNNVQLCIVVPILVFWTSYFTFKRFREFILSLDILFLNTIQCFRVLGGGILIIWGYGLLPGGFAIPMSILDMSVGFIAIYAVYYTANSIRGWERLTFWMNSWGFVDFFVTILLVIIGQKLSIDPPMNSQGYAKLSLLPLSLFPTFAIGFFSCCHFAVFVKLRDMKRKNLEKLKLENEVKTRVFDYMIKE